MDKLRNRVREAQWWLGLQRFVNALGWCWFACLLLAVGVVAYDRYRPIGADPVIWVVSALGLGAVLAAAWAAARNRGPLDAAVEIDRRFGLKERVSSAWALSPEDRDTPLGQALVHDSLAQVERVRVRQKFPIRPGRQLLLPLVPGLAAVLVLVLIEPELAQTTPDENAGQKVVQKQVQTVSKTLRRKLDEKRKEAEKQGLKEAQEALGKLQRDLDNLSKQPADRKEAMVKLNELAREMEQRKLTLGSPDQVRRQLNQMRDLQKGPADRLAEKMAKGDFEKAIEELKKLQQDVAGGKLSKEQANDLAKQLADMEKKLNEQVDAQNRKQEQLQKAIDQARAEGKHDQADKLEQQLQQLRQQCQGNNQLQQMAQKLGACSKCLQQGQTKDAAGQLQSLQADLKDLQRRLNEADMIDATMDQLSDARQQMGCKQCGGQGCEACQGQNGAQGGGEGQGNEKGGMGMGKGRGAGARPERATDVHFRDTQASVKVEKGQLLVVGEADGPNRRGDVQRQLEQQVESARHERTDPLINQKIPRKQRDQVGEYFDDFRDGPR